MFRKKKKRRFSAIYPDGKSSSCKIILDKETGVNYLFVNDGVCAGLSVLVDKDNKPIITKIQNNNDNTVVNTDELIDIKPIVTSIKTQHHVDNESTITTSEDENTSET
ncbi:hypothetical protein SH2C18_38090 [Clostridium sediminicola]|uniref:DUF6440 family protein n=1 Tax=Clostridium sediminicola TaxID=3114879 RepID=UPI0031F20D00